MFILNFIRFLQGYVHFRAQGDFVERFLNLLARDRIPVWNGHKRGNTYTGCVRASSYRRLRRHSRTTGVKLRIIGKSGAPFHRLRYRKRTGLLVGFACFALFLFVMSGFIWRIEVNGNESLEDSEVIVALERVGIKPGIWRSTIDVRESERMVMLEIQELSWVALNIEGSTIHVELSERTAPPDMVDPTVPCNIVAGQTGQIVSMLVYEGQPLLQEGDTVMTGDVIVSGITEDRVGQSLFRHARADVVARIEPSLQVEVPLAQTKYVETGHVVTRRYLQLFSFDLPVYWPGRIDSAYRINRSDKPLGLLGLPLPAAILTEEHILMEEVAFAFTEEEAKSKALEELVLVERAWLDGAEIEDKTMHAWIADGVFYLKANYVCLMQIGMEKEIIIGDSDSGPSAS